MCILMQKSKSNFKKETQRVTLQKEIRKIYPKTIKSTQIFSVIKSFPSDLVLLSKTGFYTIEGNRNRIKKGTPYQSWRSNTRP